MSPSKRFSLKNIVGTLDPDIIFLQETLGDCISITKTLESLLVGWYFVAVDARRRSGGVATGWKLHSCRCEMCGDLDLVMGSPCFVRICGRPSPLLMFMVSIWT